MRAIIRSRKHIVQESQSTILQGTTTNINIVNVQQSPNLSNATHVGVGEVIAAVYVEMWVAGTLQVPANCIMSLEKQVGGSTNMSFAESIDLFSYANKNNLLQIQQGLIGAADTNPTPFFRGWIAIPKGKQRFAIGDGLVLNITAQTDDAQICGMFIYKSKS